MPVSTVNELVKTLVEAANLTGSPPVRLAQSDREDSPPFVLYQVSAMNTDPLLGAGTSGLEFWTFSVVFVSSDPSEAETHSREFQAYVDSLPVNYAVDSFVIQSAYANEASDEDRPELVSDVFLYFFTRQLSLTIGRNA